MRKLGFFALVFTVIASISAIGQQLDSTVATVKLTQSQPILLSSMSREISLYQRALSQQGRSITDDDRTAILYRMIDTVLFKQAAERDHVAVSDPQMSAFLEQTRQTLSAQQGRSLSLEDLKALVTATGQTWDYWLQLQRDQVLVQLYVTQTRAKELQNLPAPSIADMEYFYQTNIAQFAVGEIVEFKHIFINLQGKSVTEQKEARARADSLKDRIRRGESFEDLASAASEDAATKANGGYAGFLQLDQAPAKALGKEFIKGILGLKEGQVSEVIQSTAGYHILKVVRIIPAKLYGLADRLPPYYRQTASDSVRSALANQYQQQALAAAIQATATDLRKQATITINEKGLGFHPTTGLNG